MDQVLIGLLAEYNGLVRLIHWDTVIGIASFLRKGFPGVLLGWFSRLRFPYMFLITTVLFLLNLVIPDIIPFADEIIMGMGSLLLANLRKKPAAKLTSSETEEKNTG